MKVKFLLITMFTTACLQVLAQEYHRREFRVGLRGGYNFSSLYIDDVEDRNIRPGFHAGMYTQAPVGEKVNIQPEALFTTAGNRTTYVTAIGTGELDININYLQIPILLDIRLLNVIHLHLGPYAAFRLDANTFSEDNLGAEYQDIKQGSFSTMDFGLVTGVGVDLGSLQLGIRYNLGLKEIADSDAARVLVGDSKNVVGQIYLALCLNDRWYD